MLSSTKTINDPGLKKRSSTALTQNSKKVRSLKEVVLHYPTMSPSPEDWVLFPDEIIVTKCSMVRGAQVRRAKERSQPESLGLACTKDMTSTKAVTLVTPEPHKDQRSSNDSKKPRSKSKSPCDAGNDGVKNSLKTEVPHRLPTPDLSDIDEDGFWSCCGSSNTSKRNGRNWITIELVEFAQ